MEKQTLPREKIAEIAYDSVKHLKNVVGVSTPYLRREVYKVPLKVKIDDRVIDMVGIAEITVDPSGEILQTLTYEEIERRVNELLSRKA